MLLSLKGATIDIGDDAENWGSMPDGVRNEEDEKVSFPKDMDIEFQKVGLFLARTA